MGGKMQTKGKSYLKQTRGQTSVEMRQMHMPRKYDKREEALPVYSNDLILVSLLCYHEINLI